MSANPEAFKYLRKAAYRFVQKNGKDRQELFDHCKLKLSNWRESDGLGSGLTETDANQIIGDVVEWTITRYNPPRKRARRSREERAATEMSAPVLLEFAAEAYGAATVRNAASISGQSKTTVARHLRQQGVSPNREKKINALPARVKWLVAILEETFPRDGAGLVLTNDLAAGVWDKVPLSLPDTPRSTQSTRRTKLAEYAAAVSNANIGFHVIAYNDVIAVRRGRRFKGFKDTIIWIEDERRLRGIHAPKLPDANADRKSFWDDPWLNDVLDVLRIGLSPYFTDPAQLDPLLRLTRPVLDTRPLYPVFRVVIARGPRDDFARDLYDLSDRIRDPAVRRAARITAGNITRLRDWAQHRNPFDYFHDADRELAFMSHVREVAPDSYAKISYTGEKLFREFAEEFREEFYPIQKALDRCRQLRLSEHDGVWVSPTETELALYHPDNDPPF